MSMRNPPLPPQQRHTEQSDEVSPQAAGTAETEPSDAVTSQTRMSYKYQRLREKLRQAVATGELSGKLPGERALAKRFHVNAKTLSKALTDLAAEGVLDRSIGRGTYVKGTGPAASAPGRWLVLCDAESGPDFHAVSCLLDQLRKSNPDIQVATSASVADMRPSFLNAFGAVIDVACNTSEQFLRDLVVRNLPVVAVNREPKTYSTHAVLVDAALGAARIARDLMLAGHRRLAVVEREGSTTVTHTVQQVARRYDGDAVIETCSPGDMEQGRAISAAVESGVSAIICDCVGTAVRVKAALERQGVEVPSPVSLAAVGCLCGEKDQCPCSGYFVDCVPLAESVVGLLRDNPPIRPTTLWLAGEFLDCGTLAPAAGANEQRQAPALRLGGVVA
jgi:hypothetical protein